MCQLRARTFYAILQLLNRFRTRATHFCALSSGCTNFCSALRRNLTTSLKFWPRNLYPQPDRSHLREMLPLGLMGTGLVACRLPSNHLAHVRSWCMRCNWFAQPPTVPVLGESHLMHSCYARSTSLTGRCTRTSMLRMAAGELGRYAPITRNH